MWNFVSTFTKFTRPWRRTLTNGSDVKYVFPRCHRGCFSVQEFGLTSGAWRACTSFCCLGWWCPASLWQRREYGTEGPAAGRVNSRMPRGTVTEIIRIHKRPISWGWALVRRGGRGWGEGARYRRQEDKDSGTALKCAIWHQTGTVPQSSKFENLYGVFCLLNLLRGHWK